MSNAWTPGPWSVEDPLGNTLSIVEAGKETYEWRFIAHCSLPDEEDHDFTAREVEANARLIAAAPELYEALRGALGMFALLNEEEDRTKWPRWVEKAEAALAKARGEQ